MSDTGKSTPEPAREGQGKKPYTKPSLASEEIYETHALACGKLPGQGGLCNSSPKTS